MSIENGYGRRHVTALKMGQLPIFNLHGSKIKNIGVILIPIFLKFETVKKLSNCPLVQWRKTCLVTL